MLLVGSDDGVYRATDAFGGGPSVEQVLDSGQAMRVESFDGVEGAFAATTTGLYHSPDGDEWTDLGVPTGEVYAVGASPDGDRLFTGTRPARLYVADAGGLGSEPLDWVERERFRALGERDDWGIDRHDGVAQVRDVHAFDDRLVVGAEVGGVYVGDRDEGWADRRIRGFDAPHLDDIHHVAVVDHETFVAATGSGLYRTTDAGRSWRRLDADHPAWYFRESYVDGEVVYAGGSTSAPSSWDEADHALFERPGDVTGAVDSPVPGEVAVGWTARDGDPVGVTDAGTLFVRIDGGWETVGTVPSADSVYGRCVPISWVETGAVSPRR
ncbi:WD40/YVTN/BNR-like repeat-containing protein [Halorarius halobius]|uniref:WD40/YVTN/BNR-like repeat-containing protein n=1 Tax=Halorarius halobius TaxID=2962671 RepID=UPI0020CDDE85|nr:WD40 repeat domain-containing protein [Halorarius halobius]